jgi:PAS domain S-box-containing protein
MRVVTANRNFFEKSRRSISGILGQRVEEVFPSVIVDQMDLTRRIQQVFEERRPTTGQRMTYRGPGVPMRIYYYRVLPFFGQMDYAIILLEDVTERELLSKEVRRAERHLASVVESASDIVLSMDIDGRILTWNAAAERISGYTLDEIKGRFFFEYSGENEGDAKRLFGDAPVQKRSVKAEWNLVTKRRGAISVSWVFSPMKDDQQRTTGIVAVGRDLTEHRKLEKQLLKSEKLAALGVMAGGIAHELRNPLAVCSSAAQFLLADEISAEFRKECAAKIHAGIQRASIIIENLLRFARPSERADMGVVNVIAVLREALTLVCNQAKVQNIKVVPDFSDEVVSISGIESLLQQVFINLFLNAINAMPNGGTLHVIAKTANGEAIIQVIDTGCGIDAAYIGNVFDPFFTTAPVGKGTGLGLSLCYSIVTQHEGSIDVESVEGRGSVFTVRLPLQIRDTDCHA